MTGAPETFLLDSNRRAIFKHVGFVAGEERKLEAQVRLLLELPPFPIDRGSAQPGGCSMVRFTKTWFCETPA